MTEMLDLDWFMQHRNAQLPLFLLRSERTDTAPAPGSPEFMEVFQQHYVYWLKLEVEGTLIGSGPVDGGGGFAIVRAADIDEAERIAADEPMTRRGYGTTTVQRWSLNQGHAVELVRTLTQHDAAT